MGYQVQCLHSALIQAAAFLACLILKFFLLHTFPHQSFNDYNNAYTPPQTNQKNSVISQYPLNPKRKEQGKHVSPNFRNKVLYPHQLKSQTINHGPQMPGAIVKDIVETYEVRRILESDMQGKQQPELMPNVDICPPLLAEYCC
jgi:hypothetical protein